MAEASQPARKRAKRQRDSGRRTSATIEYPKIPHVPMDVIPGFVETIRASAKVLQHHRHRLFLDHESEYRKLGNRNDTDGDEAAPHPSRNSASIHDQLMNRVQNAADTARTNKEQAQLKRLEKQKLAIEAWIDSVKRFARHKASSETQEYQSQNNNDQQQNQENRKERPSVPYACFLYLWDLQQESPTKLHIRRAALYLSGMLLAKSKDCRFHLQMESNLADWIVKMTTVPKNQQEQESMSLALLQHEALRLLEKLQEQGYGSLYPKISVAVTRLRQQCPPLATANDGDDLLAENATTNDTNNGSDNMQSNPILHRNMVDWRIIRDLALKYGAKELSRVQKRIAMCHESLEILVPRMGQEFDPDLPVVDKEKDLTSESPAIEQTLNATASAEANDENGDDEDDDDDIEWEDGDEELEEKEQELLASHHHQVHHLLAVDRTLAAIQSVAGGLRGGELEIDMRRSVKEEEGMVSQSTGSLEAERKVETKARFDKLVKILREKHLPRLSLWLDGLGNADNLVKSNGAALVLLPASSIQLRQKFIRELTAAKKSVSSILSSAVRLEEKNKATGAVASTEGTEENRAEGNDGEISQLPFMLGAVPRPPDTSVRRIQPMLLSRGESQGRSALASAIARHQKRKKVHARSSRIQIKVKSK